MKKQSATAYRFRERGPTLKEQAEIDAARAEFDRFWWEEWVPRIHREEATRLFREREKTAKLKR
jgi:hypothetical protein